MNKNSLKEKLHEQEAVYVALQSGDTGSVCYKELQDEKFGTNDANYTNRLRLAYYLLYYKTDDEATVSYLFREELKDRERNSFQGIGTTLRILTFLLKKYNAACKYKALFERAKNANFDCACGYDEDEIVNNDFEKNSLLDCIYICEELAYKEIMGGLVNEWKKSITQWTSANRRLLIDFNQFLGNEAENEELFQKQLAETLANDTGKVIDVISGYYNLIHYYVAAGNWQKALHYCHIVVEEADYEQIKQLNLFKYLLENCLEVIAHNPAPASDLWQPVKIQLQSIAYNSWHGNLFRKAISAAQATGDPYLKELEQKYLEWKQKHGL